MTGDQQGRLVGCGSMFWVYQKHCVLEPRNRHGFAVVPEDQVFPCPSCSACAEDLDTGGFTGEVTPGSKKEGTGVTGRRKGQRKGC